MAIREWAVVGPGDDAVAGGGVEASGQRPAEPWLADAVREQGHPAHDAMVAGDGLRREAGDGRGGRQRKRRGWVHAVRPGDER